MEEKRSALEMLVLYSQHLGEKFAPLVEQVVEIALKNLAYYFDEGTFINIFYFFFFLHPSHSRNTMCE